MLHTIAGAGRAPAPEPVPAADAPTTKLADLDGNTVSRMKVGELKDTLQEIKRQESTNRTLRAALAKARRKITKLEGKVVDSKLDVHYLAEYEIHTE